MPPALFLSIIVFLIHTHLVTTLSFHTVYVTAWNTFPVAQRNSWSARKTENEVSFLLCSIVPFLCRNIVEHSFSWQRDHIIALYTLFCRGSRGHILWQSASAILLSWPCLVHQSRWLAGWALRHPILLDQPMKRMPDGSTIAEATPSPKVISAESVSNDPC